MTAYRGIGTGSNLAAKRGLRRREFLTQALVAGTAWLAGARAWAQVDTLHCVPPLPPGEPATFTPPASGPMRVRKSVFDLNAGEISRLKNAYAALRQLTEQTPDDPRGLSHQGQVHCWYCTGATDGLNGQEIHGGWWFLAWHRAYLYFHERILGTLINDPSFALPYWDWDTNGRNRFPSDVYGNPNDTSNPLYDSTRKVGPNDRIPDAFVGTAVMQSVLGSASFAEFGGNGDESLPVFSQTGGAQQAGSLEGAPHGGVHVWVTDPVGFSGAPNMGALGTAGFDPVFFAHHANIDRLWDVWLQGSPMHANPSNDRWLNQQPFFFYDQTPTWTGILINQVVDHETSLRYRYQPPGAAGAPTASAAAPEARARTAPRLAQVAPLSAPLVELGTTPEAKQLSPGPTTLRVSLPAQTKERLTATPSAAAAPGTKRLVLRIDGVEMPADRGAAVKVYLNRPDATAATSANERGFVGTIVVVPSRAGGAHVHRTVVRNFGFDISNELAATLGQGNDISVTLVPFTGEGKQPAAVDLRYRSVYIASR